MKLEKLNDNQIRCTLTKADLADRQIKLSELAYGSEKAKSLFRDMMLQASVEFGFEANDIPLMIEAIPMPNECVVLIITKVTDPEELDTRFSKFSQATSDALDSLPEKKKKALPEGADEILDLFKRMVDRHLKVMDDSEETPDTAKASDDIQLTRLYLFDNLDTLINAAHILKDFYNGENRLYKNSAKNWYYLVLSKSGHTPEDFNKVCNILTEFGGSRPYTKAFEAYMAEHFDLVMKQQALQKLANA